MKEETQMRPQFKLLYIQCTVGTALLDPATEKIYYTPTKIVSRTEYLYMRTYVRTIVGASIVRTYVGT